MVPTSRNEFHVTNSTELSPSWEASSCTDS
jgi:hypothetical protein